jgi:hypothetical protein
MGGGVFLCIVDIRFVDLADAAYITTCLQAGTNPFVRSSGECHG